jgi:hypothetical protein
MVLFTFASHGHRQRTIIDPHNHPAISYRDRAGTIFEQIKKQDTYSLKDTAQNIYFMLLNGGIDLLFRAVYIGIVLSFFYDHRLVAPIKNPWIYWLVLLVFEDFMYYWLHRVDHYCRFSGPPMLRTTLLQNSISQLAFVLR